MKNFCLIFTINHDIIQLYVVIVYHSDIRETEERKTHSKRPLLISTGRIIRKLKTISWCAHAWKISVSYGREASNNRRTMNREKSWRKNVGDFFSPDTCSFWLVLSRCIPSGEYKRKKWEKRKRKKKEWLRFEDVWFLCEQKSCMFILLKITRLGISERETRQIEHVVKIYRVEFSQ